MDVGCDVNIGWPKYHSITQVTFEQVHEGHEEFSQVDTPERAFLAEDTTNVNVLRQGYTWNGIEATVAGIG